MRRAPSEQCDYVFEGSAADCYIEIHRIDKVKNQIYRGVAQLVARLLWEQDAAGSNPVTRTTFFRKTAFLGGFSALIVRFLSFARPHNNRGQRGKMAVAPLVWRNAEDRKIPNPSLTGATRYFRRRYDGNLNFLALSPIMILR